MSKIASSKTAPCAARCNSASVFSLAGEFASEISIASGGKFSSAFSIACLATALLKSSMAKPQALQTEAIACVKVSSIQASRLSSAWATFCIVASSEVSTRFMWTLPSHLRIASST